MTAVVTKNPRAQLLFHRVAPARRKVEVFTELQGSLVPSAALPASVPFAISSFDGPGALEIGAELVTPSFTAAYSLTPLVATLTDSEGSPAKTVSATPLAFQSDGTFSKDQPLESVTFTLSARGAADPTIVQETFEVPFWPRVFFGVDAPLGMGGGDEAFIEALAGSALMGAVDGSFAANVGTGQRFFWAAPLSLGNPQFVVANQPLVGATLVNDAIAVTPNTVNGVPITYQLWQSDTDDLGQVTVLVSEV